MTLTLDQARTAFFDAADGVSVSVYTLPALVEVMRWRGVDVALVSTDALDFHNGCGRVDVVRVDSLRMV